jgi:hypothetical protein
MINGLNPLSINIPVLPDYKTTPILPTDKQCRLDGSEFTGWLGVKAINYFKKSSIDFINIPG